MLNRCIISRHLEIRQGQIVLNLCVICLNLTRSLEGFERLCVVPHFVKCHAEVKVSLLRLSIRGLKLIKGRLLEIIPFLIVNQIQGLPLEPTKSKCLSLITVFLLGLTIFLLLATWSITMALHTTLSRSPCIHAAPGCPRLIENRLCIIFIFDLQLLFFSHLIYQRLIFNILIAKKCRGLDLHV